MPNNRLPTEPNVLIFESFAFREVRNPCLILGPSSLSLWGVPVFATGLEIPFTSQASHLFSWSQVPLPPAAQSTGFLCRAARSIHSNMGILEKEADVPSRSLVTPLSYAYEFFLSLRVSM